MLAPHDAIVQLLAPSMRGHDLRLANIEKAQKADNGTEEPTGATTAVVADVYRRGSSHGVRQTGHCEIQETFPWT